jgi:hypothetical protein
MAKTKDTIGCLSLVGSVIFLVLSILAYIGHQNEIQYETYRKYHPDAPAMEVSEFTRLRDMGALPGQTVRPKGERE